MLDEFECSLPIIINPWTERVCSTVRHMASFPIGSFLRLQSLLLLLGFEVHSSVQWRYPASSTAEEVSSGGWMDGTIDSIAGNTPSKVVIALEGHDSLYLTFREVVSAFKIGALRSMSHGCAQLSSADWRQLDAYMQEEVQHMSASA